MIIVRNVGLVVTVRKDVFLQFQATFDTGSVIKVTVITELFLELCYNR